MEIKVTFDPSDNVLSPQDRTTFENAVNAAAQYYSQICTNDVTIKIDVGYGYVPNPNKYSAEIGITF
jgi:mannose-1-phosphate guanylyltransferase